MIELRWGYTVDDLHRQTMRAVHTAWSQAADFSDRLSAAWSAIAEHLYSTETQPSADELMLAGRRAVDEEIHAYWTTHGVDRRNPWQGEEARWNFQRFWWSSPREFEDNLVDKLSLNEIWPQLTDGHREALIALAVSDDYSLAAERVGIAYSSYRSRISKARERFFRLWHDGETPSRPWGTDRRVQKRGQERSTSRRSVTTKLRRRTAA